MFSSSRDLGAIMEELKRTESSEAYGTICWIHGDVQKKKFVPYQIGDGE